MSFQINVAEHILYDDEFIMVINKPAGLMVEPDRNGYPNLLQQVKKYLKGTSLSGYEVYAQHIHRLDRPVSGIVLFAKQKVVLKNLSEQFAERKVKKYYQALTDKAADQPAGKLENWHHKEKKKAVITADEVPYSEKAILHYETAQVTDNRFLWNIELYTGKFHQIRAQLSAVGCPIVGDAKYNSTVLYKADSIALHAYKLVFHHPITNEEIVIEKKHNFLTRY
jgi:23S rRNA pseudouridine955/2504/2580 synthase/23S rRNA pseudouridine1911/1915/1917 synthase